MENFTIRRAAPGDIPFIVDVIVAAEKGVTDNLSFATLFDLEEAGVRKYLQSILEEEIDGSEFSLSSYVVAEVEGRVIGAASGWIEGFDGTPSKIVKSNLISYTFPKESLNALINKSDLIKGILIERENLTMQLEYGYILREYRGKKIIEALINQLTQDSLKAFPELTKIQVQFFKNNIRVIKFFELMGYYHAREVTVEDEKILNFLPDKTKVLLERFINK